KGRQVGAAPGLRVGPCGRSPLLASPKGWLTGALHCPSARRAAAADRPGLEYASAAVDRRWMYVLTRATTTVLAASAAGFLLWIAARFSNDHVGDHRARIGLMAGRGPGMGPAPLPG